MRRSIADIVLVALLAFPSAAFAQSGPDIEQLFEQADLNHDGVVTRAEFAISREARFHRLDRNGDGYLSADDVPGVLRSLHPRSPRIMEMLKQYDLDHDGRISWQEFISGSMKEFDKADQDHDGVVTRAEASAAAARFKAALQSMQQAQP